MAEVAHSDFVARRDFAARCVHTPVGAVWIAASGGALVSVGWTEPAAPAASLRARRSNPVHGILYSTFWIASRLTALAMTLLRSGLRLTPLHFICNPNNMLLDEAEKQLKEYFARERRTFDLPLAEGGTPFQRTVWAALRQIPYSQTRTYGQIAAQIGRPTAARAVGGACNRNPLAILTPCHRVVGTAGALTGFAGGIAAKQVLLSVEGGV